MITQYLHQGKYLQHWQKCQIWHFCGNCEKTLMQSHNAQTNNNEF